MKLVRTPVLARDKLGVEYNARGGKKMVVKEYKMGNSVVRIHDDCMAKTPEENEKRVRRIEEIVSRYRYEEFLAKQKNA